MANMFSVLKMCLRKRSCGMLVRMMCAVTQLMVCQSGAAG
jgi:hypothetical protein